MEIHNTHHNHAFMAGIRQAVHEGTLEQYMAWFKGLKGLTSTPLPAAPVEAVGAKRWHPQGDGEDGSVEGGGDNAKRQKTKT